MEDSQTTLEDLRALRARAQTLLRHISDDLAPFLHADGITFRRKPDSRSIEGDVNVTTTCSCLMALALTGEFRRFYKLEREDNAQVAKKARAILDKIKDAPWMSSGLTSNNAFTTTLVLRTFGSLIDHGLLRTSAHDLRKPWELQLSIKRKVEALAVKVRRQRDFLYLSLSEQARTLLAGARKAERDLEALLTPELRRIVHSGWIYEPTRFPTISKETREKLARTPSDYKLAELNHLLLSDKFPREIPKPQTRSFVSIARVMATEPGKHFSINEYPPTAAVGYWFADAVEHGRIKLSEGHWNTLCSWAGKEFHRQRSLVLAKHDAMMDPVAMAMAACLCARLRATSTKANSGMSEKHRALLPSMAELEHSVKELAQHQTDSGIWPKYFPLFHYQDAGSNFCFTFELLEAVLCEFGRADNDLLGDPEFVHGLEKAVTWCERNRLTFADQGAQYTGWNSGGYLETLQKGMPESWATAVVHMFLWQLQSVLAERIQRRLLKERDYTVHYPPERPKKRVATSQPGQSPLERLLDIELLMPGSSRPESLRKILEALVAANQGRSELDLRRMAAKPPISAVLFGPPGTSKTRVTEAVAEALEWPLIVINPSDFVKGTLANVYMHVDRIFRDLMDLAGVVVFFDEMDALAQSREGADLDTFTQFLTTTMLPKLTALHDQARVVFFMATNYQERFDAAIKRAGRFDLLLCMGPPTLREKLDRLAEFLDDREGDEAEIDVLRAKLKAFARDPWVSCQLGLFTFGEFKAFLRALQSEGSLSRLAKAKFKERVQNFSKFVTLKLSDLPSSIKIENLDAIPIDQLNSVKSTAIGKYLLDRRASRRQY